VAVAVLRRTGVRLGVVVVGGFLYGFLPAHLPASTSGSRPSRLMSRLESLPARRND
jgi:hypothetical protein